MHVYSFLYTEKKKTPTTTKHKQQQKTTISWSFVPLVVLQVKYYSVLGSI